MGKRRIAGWCQCPHVRIGPVRGGVTLTAQQPGTFEVETAVEKPDHIRKNTPPIQRIRFIPKTRSKNMTLKFVIV